jgi:hypothetical protein
MTLIIPCVNVAEAVTSVHVLVEDSDEVDTHLKGLLSHTNAFSSEHDLGLEVLEGMALYSIGPTTTVARAPVVRPKVIAVKKFGSQYLSICHRLPTV